MGVWVDTLLDNNVRTKDIVYYLENNLKIYDYNLETIKDDNGRIIIHLVEFSYNGENRRLHICEDMIDEEAYGERIFTCVSLNHWGSAFSIIRAIADQFDGGVEIR